MDDIEANILIEGWAVADLSFEELDDELDRKLEELRSVLLEEVLAAKREAA